MKFAGRELALCTLLSLGSVEAASTTATLRIGLTVAASCRVDSAALTSSNSTGTRRRAAVNCGVEAPYAVNISTESVQRRLTDSQTPAGPVRVVTLAF